MKTKTMSSLGALTLSVSTACLLASGAQAAQVFTTDVIVQGSLCVGLDCTSAENFGFDTIRMKENNTRLKFDDTSNSGSFPSNDWTLVANDSTNGGQSYLGIEDTTAGKMPFKVMAGARSNALIVTGTRVGFGTAAPAVQMHEVYGDSPALRLEQDGSSGWTPQTWDVAGNETNFFVRDVTHASALPFRILPGSANNYTLNLTGSGTAEFGSKSNGYSTVRLVDIISSTASQLRLASPTENRRIVARDPGSNTTKSQIIMKDDGIVMAGATDASNTWATVHSTGTGISLMDVSGDVAAQYRLVGNTENRRIVALDTASSGVDTQMIMKNSSIVFAGANDTSQKWATISAAGIVTNIGSCTNASPCDAVFDPEVYKVPSIEEHAKEMWSNKYLPFVGPTKQGAPVNVTQKMTSMLAELEQAHIYIAELNTRVKELEAKVDVASAD